MSTSVSKGSPEGEDLVMADEVITSGISERSRQKIREGLLDVLIGHIRNRNTRNAYRVAWRSFLGFCKKYSLELQSVRAVHLGLWIDGHPGSEATQRQHLAAVRLLFDELLKQGLIEYNPAARTKPERLDRAKSHTPVFEEAEIVAFLNSVELKTERDIRNFAMFCVLLYSWARVSALIALKVQDYYERKGQRWFRFKEKRGKVHEVPVHSKAKEAVEAWLDISGLRSEPTAPLFPALQRGGQITRRHMDRTTIFRMVQVQARTSNLMKNVCCHSFRATGITEYMCAGGSIDIAQRIAGHAQLSTTKIYDRSKDRVTIAEVERVSIGLKGPIEPER